MPSDRDCATTDRDICRPLAEAPDPCPAVAPAGAFHCSCFHVFMCFSFFSFSCSPSCFLFSVFFIFSFSNFEHFSLFSIFLFRNIFMVFIFFVLFLFIFHCFRFFFFFPFSIFFVVLLFFFPISHFSFLSSFLSINVNFILDSQPQLQISFSQPACQPSGWSCCFFLSSLAERHHNVHTDHHDNMKAHTGHMRSCAASVCSQGFSLKRRENESFHTFVHGRGAG